MAGAGWPRRGPARGAHVLPHDGHRRAGRIAGGSVAAPGLGPPLFSCRATLLPTRSTAAEACARRVVLIDEGAAIASWRGVRTGGRFTRRGEARPGSVDRAVTPHRGRCSTRCRAPDRLGRAEAVAVSSPRRRLRALKQKPPPWTRPPPAHRGRHRTTRLRGQPRHCSTPGGRAGGYTAHGHRLESSPRCGRCRVVTASGGDPDRRVNVVPAEVVRDGRAGADIVKVVVGRAPWHHR